METVSYFAAFVGGMIVAGAIGWKLMPSLMIRVKTSRLSFDETVEQIGSTFGADRWQVPKIYDIQKSLVEAGHGQATKMKILSMCHPDHANEILEDDERKKVLSIMPCRIGVYETADGGVQVAQMNVGLMSKMFGGKIESVMAKVAADETKRLEPILTK